MDVAETNARRPHASARTKARKRALDILFESELRSRDPLETLVEREGDADRPVPAFAREIVCGVVQNQLAIDQRIAESLASGWTLERMPRVDRTVARIAVYELDYTPTPPDVAISEAVALAGALSTDESPAFVNAVLATALAAKARASG